MATTRLGLYGGTRPPYGSFADKESTVKPRLTRLGLHGGARPPYSDHSRAAVGKDQPHITRLGLHGGPRMRYSSFAKSVVSDEEAVRWIYSNIKTRPQVRTGFMK